MTSTPRDEPNEAVRRRVDEAIETSDVVLFMKGTPERPRCGFSQRAVGLIARHRDEFRVVNVLEDLPAYRAALERHSGWETIPQAYVDGEFVGGSDILAELDERGDLRETLAVEGTA
ncbi:MAG: glutaredoxin family protein [Halolamina sp.]